MQACKTALAAIEGTLVLGVGRAEIFHLLSHAAIALQVWRAKEYGFIIIFIVITSRALRSAEMYICTYRLTAFENRLAQELYSNVHNNDNNNYNDSQFC